MGYQRRVHGQKIQLEQQQAQTLAQPARAQQARAQAEMQSRYTGYTAPVPLDESVVNEQKEHQAGIIAQRAEAQLQHLTAQYEMQKEMITLESQRSLDMALSQIAVKQQQSALALD